MFRFAHPLYFLLLLPLGVAAWFVYRRGIRTGLLFAPTFRLPSHVHSWRTAAANILPAFALTGMLLCVIALARPQVVLSRIRRSSDVIAIEMVVDVSGSMKALDLAPDRNTLYTRLDAVKDAFADFVEKRPDDLIGIVAFGGFASTRAPLTLDHGALLHVLKGLAIPKPTQDRTGNIVSNEELLTAIGDALATACARIEDVDVKSRIVVLLSDGESNTGIIKPKAAAEAARKLGIKVYTIGVGSTGRAWFPVKDMFGRQRAIQRQVSLDEATLKDIAKTTDGRYFNVRDSKGLERALEDIDQLEKTRIERDVYSQYNEFFPYFLVPALLLLVLSSGLNMLIARRII